MTDQLYLERDVSYEVLTGVARFEVFDGNRELVGLITEVTWIGATFENYRGWQVCSIPRPRLFGRPPPDWHDLEVHNTPQDALGALADHRARR